MTSSDVLILGTEEILTLPFERAMRFLRHLSENSLKTMTLVIDKRLFFDEEVVDLVNTWGFGRIKE